MQGAGAVEVRKNGKVTIYKLTQKALDLYLKFEGGE